jgi:hypothetical protein
MEILMLQTVYQLQYCHSVGQNIIKIVTREWQNSECDGLMRGIVKYQDPRCPPFFYLFIFLFKVCKSVHHRTIQINHQPDTTVFQFIILTFIYSSTCFGRFLAHRQDLNDCSGSLWFTFVSWWQLCCVRGRAGQSAGLTTNTARLSPRYEGKPEATTAVIELLMMGGNTPKTCWAVNKRQGNKRKNCWMRLVIYLNWTMMHGLTNHKFYI